MLLEHIGEPGAASRLMRAIESVTAKAQLHTKDLGGNARTEEVTNAVRAHVAQNASKPSNTKETA